MVENSTLTNVREEDSAISVKQMRNRESSFQEPSVFDFSNTNATSDGLISGKKPFPDPPLANFNIARAPKLKNIDRENWNEGTDTKMRAYTWLRNEKEKMFDQNREWTRFRQVFRGLHRVHERAKRPNKITEYDMPVSNSVKLKKYKSDQK